MTIEEPTDSQSDTGQKKPKRRRPWWARILVYGLAATLVVGTITLLACGAILYDPTIVFKIVPKDKVSAYLNQAGIDLDLKAIDLDVVDRDGLSQTFALMGQPGCLKQGLQTQICWQKIDIRVTVDYSQLPPRLKVIGPVTVDLDTIDIKQPPEQQPLDEPVDGDTTSFDDVLASLQTHLSATKLDALTVRIKQANFEATNMTAHIKQAKILIQPQTTNTESHLLSVGFDALKVQGADFDLDLKATKAQIPTFSLTDFLAASPQKIVVEVDTDIPQVTAGPVHLQATVASIGTHFDLGPKGIEGLAIDQLKVAANKLTLVADPTVETPTATKAKTKAPASPSTPITLPTTLAEVIPAIAQTLRVDDIDVAVNNINMPGELAFSGPIRLIGGIGPSKKITVQLPKIKVSGIEIVQSRAQLHLLKDQIQDGMSLQLTTRMTTAPLARPLPATFKATIQHNLATTFTLSADPHISYAEQPADNSTLQSKIVLSGTFDRKDLKLKLDIQGKQQTPAKIVAQTDGCQLGLMQIVNFAKKLDLDLNCALKGYVEISKQKWKDSPVRRLELATKTQVSASLTHLKELSLEGSIKAEATNKAFELESGIDASVKLKANLENPWTQWDLKPEMAAYLKATSFETIVEHFHLTPAAIPAPFNQLKGWVEIKVKSRPEFVKESMKRVFKFPFWVASNLKGTQQYFNTQSYGHFTIDLNSPHGSFALTGNTDLTNIETTLFTLPLEQPPQLAPDPRIITAAEVEPKKQAIAQAEPAPKIEVDWTWSTINHPIKINTNLTKGPIPIRSNGRFQLGGPLVFDVRLEAFYMELFRRQALIKSLQLKSVDNDQISLDGEVEVDYTDAKVSVKLLGSVAEPVINVTSSPHMSRDRIMMLLLFGKDMKELDTDSIASVNQAQAAIATGAVSLMSLYYLASTPIQSISYDPDSNFVGVRVKVSDGTTINVGKGSEYERAGSRTRLWEDWFLNSYVERRQDQDNVSVTSLVEWFKRFW